jgi:SAM-dependent methyltransferase/glycosyltransferase involved in cell wall biosynthesis
MIRELAGTLPQTLTQRTAGHFDQYAETRPTWQARNRYYYQEIEHLARATIPPGARVLEIGCGTGDLLAALRPSFGLGIDVSERMVDVARRRHRAGGSSAGSGSGGLTFICADAHSLPLNTTFDYIVCSNLIGHLEDIEVFLKRLHAVCTPQTKILITYWNFLWQGVLSFAERLGLKMPEYQQNWLGMADVDNLLVLTDFAARNRGSSLLVPRPVPVLAPLLNRLVRHIPALQHLALVTHWVVQPVVPRPTVEPLSCTVIVPCRNEEGNIADCVERMPALGTHTEVIFVDGASTDGTRDRILEQMARYAGTRDIKLIDQIPAEVARPAENGPVKMLRLGKGDAVRKGFAAAKGDVLFILDADLTVPPEELPKFLEPIATGKADFVNGTRLVYPLEDEAMLPIRFLGNKFFSLVFTWLLEQPIKDTLCGTKVLRKRDYDRLAANRSYFGDFDPFGDFDLLFGAARLGLRIVEVPVRYRRRTSGYSKVQVLQHGPLLLRMSLIGFRRLKWASWREARRGRRKEGQAFPSVVALNGHRERATSVPPAAHNDHAAPIERIGR